MKLRLLSGSFILLGILLALLAGVSDARLSVSSPEGTLDRADLAVTGTVIERNYGDEYRRITIGVNEILKGTADEKQIKLERKKNDVYGWTGFDFPEPGTEIFLLLGGDQTRGYDESQLSRLEAKLSRFLSSSKISRRSIEIEKDRIKSLISDISSPDQNTHCQQRKVYLAAYAGRTGQTHFW